MGSTIVSSSTSLTSLCQKFGDISGNFHEAEVGEQVLDSPSKAEKVSAAKFRKAISPTSTDPMNGSERRLFCVFEEHKEISFGRRSDWRKHMTSFPKPDKKVWQCPDCYEYFDQMLNYNQHHLIHHCQRKTCKHSNTATKLRYSKRAFACGRQSCERLLYSWDEWQNHVIEHMEDRMSEDEWQYNTFFRNLFRREEIHSRWEKYVSDQLGHYNVVARFNWRPRNTLLLRLKLEYFETISDIEADKLVEDAYQIGLEVRTAHELLDPSTLITEPSTIRSQTGLSSCESSLQGQRIDKFNLAIEGSGKDPKEPPSPPPNLTLDDAFLMIGGNGSISLTSPAQQCEMPAEDWNVSNWLDIDMGDETSFLDTNPN